MEYSHKLGRWSLARCQNTNHINKLFKDDANRIEEIDDKQDKNNLVILRKDLFEKILRGYNMRSDRMRPLRLAIEILRDESGTAKGTEAILVLEETLFGTAQKRDK